ncbi:MAG TPA: phospholipase [Reyranella sp.]|jgi:phospholipase/carboxylesterase|nr:phospholipase [Reyranella sp.]
MSAPNEPVVDLISRLVPAILKALYALEFAGRHLSPTTLADLIDAVGSRRGDLDRALAASRGLDWPERLLPARECLEKSAAATSEGVAGLLAAPQAEQPIVAAYRALRAYARAAEALYPMAPHLRPVSQFFLEPAARNDAGLLERLATVDPARDGVGVMHVGGPAGTRGGFSMYVPESYDPAHPCPLVVAMHGGSGNGGAFLWSWLREARTRNFILVAPTARGSTWSLMEPDIDGSNIEQITGDIAAKWNIDPARQLLTGMSDGGTFTYVLGLQGGCRFTHLAPVAASFHPLILAMANADRLHELPICIVHGAQDWMFPAEMARGAERALRQAGANVIYRRIEDLAHTYPRDENGPILDWFTGQSTLQQV